MQRVWSTYLEQGQAAQAENVANNRRPMDYPHRRASSSMSHPNSIASSTRHILPQVEVETILEPPSAPFASNNSSLSPRGSFRSLTPSNSALLSADPSTPLSLSVNYIPSKFSGPLSPGIHKRKNGKGGPKVPKRGGGREAFKSGESRMPGENDDDYDGVDGAWMGGKDGGKTKRKLRWNRFKWILFFSNLCLTAYTLTGLIALLLTWFNVWHNADIIRVGNTTELIVSTVAAAFGLVTSVVGWAGILLNNRSFLAVYTLMCWISFGLLVVPGYLTYKQRAFNLEGKINAQWSRDLGLDGRLRIQNQLQCCGYYSPFVEATVSQTCYARSMMPGCKSPYLHFERTALERWYAASFGLVPLQIGIIVAALLCSNHITYRFGKGMMPKAYRLSMNSMAVIMDNYASQLAEQYGPDAASEILNRSRSNLQLDSMPTVPYSPNSATSFGQHATFGSIGGSMTDEYGKRL